MSSGAMQPGTLPWSPLWRRAPSHDDHGRLASDVLMLIPRLSQAPVVRQEAVCRQLCAALDERVEDVLYADFNQRLNLLWVSVRTSPGCVRDTVRAVRERVPEALVIGLEGVELTPETLPRFPRLSALGSRIRSLCVSRAPVRLDSPSD